jgi:phosphoenolpyruvate synthase/pyruvate phosphate dikinase
MDQPEHVYPAVLLMRSVAVEKSGVMVTQDIDTGDPAWLSVAVNEGVGGAVEGQAAESLRIHLSSGQVRLLAQATSPTQYRLKPQGGLDKIAASGTEQILQEDEITQLIQLAREVPNRFSMLKDAAGHPAPADIEFGFLKGQLKLFQIRPFLESARARRSGFLRDLDKDIHNQAMSRVRLNTIPKGNTP